MSKETFCTTDFSADAGCTPTPKNVLSSAAPFSPVAAVSIVLLCFSSCPRLVISDYTAFACVTHRKIPVGGAFLATGSVFITWCQRSIFASATLCFSKMCVEHGSGLLSTQKHVVNSDPCQPGTAREYFRRNAATFRVPDFPAVSRQQNCASGGRPVLTQVTAVRECSDEDHNRVGCGPSLLTV